MEETTLLDYLNGKLSFDECLNVDRWVECSSENRRLLEQLYCVHFIGNRVADMQQVDVEEKLIAFKQRIKVTKKKKTTFSMCGWREYGALIAAFLTGIIVTSCFIYYMLSLQNDRPCKIYTKVNETTRIELPDGSDVWLNESSELSYNTTFFSRKRNVQLNGEAYFEVAHDEQSPFVVSSSDVKIAVLGTKFDVCARMNESKISATLFEGSVCVEVPGNKETSYVLKPLERFTLDVKSKRNKIISYNKAENSLSWIDNKLRFQDAKMKDVVQCLSLHYKRKIIIDDILLMNETYTCEFSLDEKLEEIISILEKTKRFTYSIQDGVIRIEPIH